MLWRVTVSVVLYSSLPSIALIWITAVSHDISEMINTCDWVTLNVSLIYCNTPDSDHQFIRREMHELHSVCRESDKGDIWNESHIMVKYLNKIEYPIEGCESGGIQTECMTSVDFMSNSRLSLVMNAMLTGQSLYAYPHLLKPLHWCWKSLVAFWRAYLRTFHSLIIMWRNRSYHRDSINLLNWNSSLFYTHHQ